MRRQRRAGFTLIELMLAVVIVGALAAIAIPNFLRFQCRAKQKEGLQLASAVYTAEQAYFGEWGNFLSLDQLTGFGGLDPRSISGAKYYTCFVMAPWEIFWCYDGKQRVGVDGWVQHDQWLVIMDQLSWPGYRAGIPLQWVDTCLPP